VGLGVPDYVSDKLFSSLPNNRDNTALVSAIIVRQDDEAVLIVINTGSPCNVHRTFSKMVTLEPARQCRSICGGYRRLCGWCELHLCQ